MVTARGGAGHLGCTPAQKGSAAQWLEQRGWDTGHTWAPSPAWEGSRAQRQDKTPGLQPSPRGQSIPVVRAGGLGSLQPNTDAQWSEQGAGTRLGCTHGREGSDAQWSEQAGAPGAGGPLPRAHHVPGPRGPAGLQDRRPPPRRAALGTARAVRERRRRAQVGGRARAGDAAAAGCTSAGARSGRGRTQSRGCGARTAQEVLSLVLGSRLLCLMNGVHCAWEPIRETCESH